MPPFVTSVPRCYFDDPGIELEEFGAQPATDYIQNPPTHIIIMGTRYKFEGQRIRYRAGSNNEEFFYCVTLPDSKDWFYVSTTKPGRFMIDPPDRYPSSPFKFIKQPDTEILCTEDVAAQIIKTSPKWQRHY